MPACFTRAPRAMLLAAFVGSIATGVSAAPPASSRGELLYATHCIECHNEQIHWRERKLARDWASLRREVERWQAQARLGWSEADVDEVTRYLAEAVYQFPGRRSTAVIRRVPSRRAV